MRSAPPPKSPAAPLPGNVAGKHGYSVTLAALAALSMVKALHQVHTHLVHAVVLVDDKRYAVGKAGGPGAAALHGAERHKRT